MRNGEPVILFDEQAWGRWSNHGHAGTNGLRPFLVSPRIAE